MESPSCDEDPTRVPESRAVLTATGSKSSDATRAPGLRPGWAPGNTGRWEIKLPSRTLISR